MTVWIYVDTTKQVGDRDHLKVFANDNPLGVNGNSTWLDTKTDATAFGARWADALRKQLSSGQIQLLAREYSHERSFTASILLKACWNLENLRDLSWSKENGHEAFSDQLGHLLCPY
jgi:hypothetical protein